MDRVIIAEHNVQGAAPGGFNPPPDALHFWPLTANAQDFIGNWHLTKAGAGTPTFGADGVTLPGNAGFYRDLGSPPATTLEATWCCEIWMPTRATINGVIGFYEGGTAGAFGGIRGINPAVYAYFSGSQYATGGWNADAYAPLETWIPVGVSRTAAGLWIGVFGSGEGTKTNASSTAIQIFPLGCYASLSGFMPSGFKIRHALWLSQARTAAQIRELYAG